MGLVSCGKREGAILSDPKDSGRNLGLSTSHRLPCISVLSHVHSFLPWMTDSHAKNLSDKWRESKILQMCTQVLTEQC